MQIRRRRRPFIKKEVKITRVNLMIRVPQVKLIDENGDFIGIVDTQEALRRAQTAGLDLVEVNPKDQPPMTRIMDWGQLKYEREKKERKAKAKQKKTEVKSVRLSFRIKGSDLEMRRAQTMRFLDDGQMVKLEIILRGRERAHRELAKSNLQKFVTDLGPEISTIAPVSVQGGNLSITIVKRN